MEGWARFRVYVCKSNEIGDEISEWNVSTAAQMGMKYLALAGLCSTSVCSKEGNAELLVPIRV